MPRRLVVGLTVVVACSLMAVGLAVGQTEGERPIAAEMVQANEGNQRYAILEAMLRDLREELRALKDAVIEESQRIVREGLDDTRRLLNEMRVEIKPGEAGEHYTVHQSADTAGYRYYQARSTGFVTATAQTGGAGRCILYGYAAVAAQPENLRSDPYLRAVSSLQYAPGGNQHVDLQAGGYRIEDIHPYLPLDSITFPVRKNELWTVTGCGDDKTKIKFYTVKLSGQ